MKKKIVFAAIVGFTGEETRDHRVLSRPVNDHLQHRDYPMPVRAIVYGKIEKIGVIEMAAWCDRRIIIFGRIFDDSRFDFLVHGLASGNYAFEMDMDQTKVEMGGDVADPIIRMVRWRLAGVMVGTHPCWKLPRVQIEEFEIKEKDHV